MYFHDLTERAAKQLAPGVLARTVWGEKTLAAVVDLEPGSVVPNHSHHHEQIGIVLEGELEMTIAGETKVLRPGDMYVIPGGTEHGAKGGAITARVLDVFSPVREEYKY